jgi:hypothetical protein
MSYLNPTSGELEEYLADLYGTCSRGDDCYHGKNSNGKDNGCLKQGWRGRACPYWQPATEDQIALIKKAYGVE